MSTSPTLSPTHSKSCGHEAGWDALSTSTLYVPVFEKITFNQHFKYRINFEKYSLSACV